MRKILALFAVFAILLFPNLASAAKAWTKDTGSTLSTSLVSYWAQEDLTDTFSTNNQTGVASPTFTAGKNGNALTLNGSTQYTTVASGVIPHQQNMSISLWFKMNATNVGYYIGGETGSGNNMYIDWNNNVANKFRWNKLDSGTNKTADFATTTDTNWHSMILVHDSSSPYMTMYIDGASAATNTTNSTPASPGAVWEWGSFSGLNSPLNGQIDEVAVWTKTLSATEISDLYNSGTGSFYQEAAAVVTTPLQMQVIWFEE